MPCSFTVLSNIFRATFIKGRSLKLLLATILLASVSFSCMSLDYVAGVYEKDIDQQIDVLVRVKNQRDTAVTDLVLNDFYVRQNAQVLERTNNLRLDENLSVVKLYLVILIDQRKNDLLKHDFERTRQALQAYLTLQSPNTYIKMISYGHEARAQNPEFSNDTDMLQGLLKELDTVQMEASDVALEDALAMAEESIEALPYGAYVLDPQKFTVAQVRNAQSPLLYNSAILLMNHNKISIAALSPYKENHNFIILESTKPLSENSQGQINPLLKAPVDEDDEVTIFEEHYLPTIFESYELPPENLNKNANQSVAIELVDKVWKSLANIVNGYYWLSYNKYTDVSNTDEPRLVSVSLTQYGRSKDDGTLGYYRSSSSSESAESLGVDDSVASLLPAANDLPVVNDVPVISDLPVVNEYDLLAFLPGQHFTENLPIEEKEEDKQEEKQEETTIKEEREPPVVDDFEILAKLGTDKSEGLLVSRKDSPAPQYTAKPIRLVGVESVPKLVVPEEDRIIAPKNDPVLVPFSNGRYIQVGAFTKLKNLYSMIEGFSGEYDVRAVSSTVDGRKYNRCIIGPFKNKAETGQVLRKLKFGGRLSDAFIIRKPIEEWIGK